MGWAGLGGGGVTCLRAKVGLSRLCRWQLVGSLSVLGHSRCSRSSRLLLGTFRGTRDYTGIAKVIPNNVVLRMTLFVVNWES
jgi:hypothetical protein